MPRAGRCATDRVEDFRQFVAARQTALLRSAWLLTGDWQAAEDLVQEALVRAWPQWEKLSAGGYAEAYVRRSVINRFLDGRRKDKRLRPRPPEHADLGYEPTGFDGVDRRDLVLRLLRELPPRQRAIVVLRYYEDRSEREIADLVGCSPGTVKSQSSRALARLRGELAKERP